MQVPKVQKRQLGVARRRYQTMVQVLRGNYTRKTVKFAQIETMTVMMGYRSWGKMTEALLKDQPSQCAYFMKLFRHE